MSGNGEEDKPDPAKVGPLDLASKVTVKSMDGKTPLLIPRPGQLRVLTSGNPSGQTGVGNTILATNIVPQAVLKQGQPPQRSTQITLAAQVVTQNPSSGTTFHVPRGPAVVANLSAPRSNVAAAIRAPLVVPTQTGQPTAFVRPPRTPSPAQGTTWLNANSANGTQLKSGSTVHSSPVRGTTVTGVGTIGKQQIIARTPTTTPNMSTLRPTILHSAITIGQGQIHSFKPTGGTTGIQTLTSTVTLTPVLPNRTQTIVYTGGNNTHFTSSPRLTVANTAQNQRNQPISVARTVGQVTTTRLAMPVAVTQSGATRLVAPQGAVLAPNARLSTLPSSQATVIGTASARIAMTTQQNVSIGRLPVATVTPAGSQNILGQTKISLQPLLVANTSQARTIQTQGAKIITQPAHGTAIHLAQIPATIKPTQNVVATTSTRTINVPPATLVAQRQGTVVTQAIPITKVYSSQENQQPVAQNLYIQPVTSVPRRASPGPGNASQAASSTATTTVATYSIASGAYFYDASGNYSGTRNFSQQPATFTSLPQSSAQQIRPVTLGNSVHSLVTNPTLRYNSIMVVDQPKAQLFPQDNPESQQHQTPKVTSSPRPSILRKRDHDGSPMKASKNLAPVLANLVQPPPISPPSRPDSRGNGHSSEGGSTTISATSSPGLAEANEDSMPHAPVNIKEEEENRPPMEMSPRKKPRKQQLTGNDIDEVNDDMEFLSENIKKEEPDSDGNQSDGLKDGAPESNKVSQVRKPASALLINSYRHNWKTTHNHYLRYSDVRPKEERRPNIIDLANQHRVLDKINGWKIHHLSTQMDDLADQEQTVYNQLNEFLKLMEAKEGQCIDQDLNRINELIKGNLQRIKIINDGMVEAKSNIMKVFDHKDHISDIINRCASKRNFKKREKS